jgi:hypothetical protein
MGYISKWEIILRGENMSETMASISAKYPSRGNGLSRECYLAPPDVLLWRENIYAGSRRGESS